MNNFIDSGVGGGRDEYRGFVPKITRTKKYQKGLVSLSMGHRFRSMVREVNVPPIPEHKTPEYIKPRKWQKEAFYALRDKRQAALNAFTGAGKSIVMTSLAEWWLQDKDKMCIISVPQRVIAKGFKASLNLSELGMPDEVDFIPTVLHDELSGGIVNWLANRIQNKAVSDRCVVCSHATLAAVFDALEDRSALKDVILWIDESHHVSSGWSIKTEETEELCLTDEELGINKLGNILLYYLENDFQVNLATATPFRSDSCKCVPREYADRFEIYSLPIDDYIGSCHHVCGLRYDFVFFDDYLKTITELFSQKPFDRTIVFIPRTNSGSCGIRDYANDIELSKRKHAEVQKIIKAINPRAKIEKVKAGIYKTRLAGRSIIVADMVTERYRKEVSDYISRENRSGNYGVDVIIAMDTFKEGADYRPLARAIVIDFRKSVVEISQIFGRIMRDYRGKDTPKLVHLLPRTTLENYEDEELIDVLNKYLSCIVASMLMISATFPKQIRLKVKPLIDEMFGEPNGESVSTEDQQDFDKGVYSEVVRNITETEMETPEGNWAAIDRAGDKVASRLDLRKELIQEMKRRAKEDLAYAMLSTYSELPDLEILCSAKPVDFLARFSTGALGVASFKELRRKFDSRADEKKMELLKMARTGQSRPTSSKTRLGQSLVNYTCMSSGTYDKDFDEEVRRLAPSWFENTADDKKEKLLAMAKANELRPSSKTRLGQSLVNYTCMSSETYDESFYKEIHSLAPSWFINPSDTKKKELLALARSGKSKPSHKNTLGQALSRYTGKNSRIYDETFDKEICKTAPQWFVDTTVSKKNELLALAKAGKSRPSQKTSIGASLCGYTQKKAKVYDKDFDEEVRRLAPSWFINTAVANKEKLLRMAKDGKPRPNSRSQIGSSLSRYTNESQGVFDKYFDREIRKLAPSWFVSTSSVRKEILLKMARGGQARPGLTDPLGVSLKGYIVRSSGTYDASFEREIRRLAPSWFTRKRHDKAQVSKKS